MNQGILGFPLSEFTKTFKYTGAQQTFVVPSDVYLIRAIVRGAAGGTSSAIGGRGLVIAGNLSVSPGQTLYLYIGGQGAVATSGNTGGGYNGGGHSSADWYSGAGGGGATDIRLYDVALASRIAVAGGGGGGAGGPAPFYAGGDAGIVGSDGLATSATDNAGKGATLVAGGAAGTGSPFSSAGNTAGSYGQGGNSKTSGESPCSGGGGGGLYGGGGASGGNAQHSGGAGGGGGSSLIPSGWAVAGFNAGHGEITISYGTTFNAAPR